LRLVAADADTRPSTHAHGGCELLPIECAQHRILIHTFILIGDSVGNQIIDRLCEKARDGVQVRLMIDGFGSFVFPDELLQRVEEAGGRSVRFKPPSKLSRFAYSNFRNHRKMAIADSGRALIGGANFVEYEMTATPDDETWIDYCLSTC
jgi:cardiolipin synthase